MVMHARDKNEIGHAMASAVTLSDEVTAFFEDSDPQCWVMLTDGQENVYLTKNEAQKLARAVADRTSF